MLELIIFTLLILIGIFLIRIRPCGDLDDSWQGVIGIILAVCGGLILILIIICIPFMRMGCQFEIEGYKALQETLDNARSSDNISEYEMVAIQKEVISANQEIAKRRAKARHWSTFINYSKETKSLELIK